MYINNALLELLFLVNSAANKRSEKDSSQLQASRRKKWGVSNKFISAFSIELK